MMEEDFEDEADEEETDGDNEMLSNLLGGILTKSKENPPAAQTTLTQTPFKESAQPVNFSDEEIKGALSTIKPKYLKMAKLMNDEQIKAFIKTKYPFLNDETLNRGLTIFKQNF
jgi:hypothetical protein